MPNYKSFEGVGLGRPYREQLDENFAEVDTDIKNVQADVNSKNSANNSRMTQIEQDRITKDNQLDAKIDTKAQESIDRDNDINSRIDTIISVPNDGNAEIADARKGRATLGALTGEIVTKLSEQNSQTQTLVHGLNKISSDTPGPLKVEFYGNSLVNDLGKQGQGETKYSTNTIIPFNARGYVLFKLHIKGDSANGGGLAFTVRETATGTVVFSSGYIYNSSYSLYYNKAYLDPAKDYEIRFVCSGTGGFAKDVSVYNVSETNYNEIGVLPEYTGDKLADKFPYVDSIQHVKNPVLSVSGANLLPPFTEWTLHANAKVISPYELDLNLSSLNEYNRVNIDVLQNTKYIITVEGNAVLNIYYFNKYNEIISSNGFTTSKKISFTTPTNCTYIRLDVGGYTGSLSGRYCSKPMLALGTTEKPFTEYTQKYIYAETVLAGNSNKKDILTEMEGQLYRIPWWVADEIHDGSKAWTFDYELTGMKRIRLSFSYTPSNSILVDHQGLPVPYDNTVKAGTYYFSGTSTSGTLYIDLADSETGWGEDYTPTSNEMKANFWGWRLCDGTYGTPYNGTGTKTWYPKGDTDLTRAVTTVPTSESPTITEGKIDYYKLTYQRATAGTPEPVKFEGSLSISGDAIVEVGEGLIWEETANPVYVSSGDYYTINYNQFFPASNLKRKLNEFIEIYKDGVPDIHNWSITGGTGNYGNYRATIKPSLFDTNAVYKVRYTINDSDKYNFTTNINEVKATYSNSLKSSFAREVERLTDVSTQTTVNTNTLYEVLKRLKVLEG